MILLVRLNPGLVGESRRTVHIVGVPDEETPTHRTAHCGLTIHAGQAELVTEPAGMPCEHRLARMPLPGAERVPRELPVSEARSVCSEGRETG